MFANIRFGKTEGRQGEKRGWDVGRVAQQSSYQHNINSESVGCSFATSFFHLPAYVVDMRTRLEG